MSKFDPGTTPKGKRTFAAQDKLPKLPIPPLEATCRRYLEALKALQNEHEHELTTAAVEEFLEKDGPNIQEVLVKWAESRDRYVRCSPELRGRVDSSLQLYRGILVRIYSILRLVLPGR
jgi:hypothetical protein